MAFEAMGAGAGREASRLPLPGFLKKMKIEKKIYIYIYIPNINTKNLNY
jgi:hypothetical protein